MNKRTLTALQGSIRKWERIVAETGEDDGTENCPLCQIFYEQRDRCCGCPVSRATGMTDCHYKSGLGLGWNPQRSDKAAREMLKFLRDLLPKTRSRS